MASSLDPEKVRGTRHTSCTSAGPVFVSTNAEGRLLRIEPMRFDEDEVDSWQIDNNGKTYKPPLIHPLLTWGMLGKQLTYTKDRVRYPLKRVDWNPHGNRNPQNRGISGYERISWDEAYDILEEEFRRIIDTYGASALSHHFSAHPEWGSIHYFFSDWVRFWDMLDATTITTTPASWEGWSSGATFVWGFWPGFGLPPAPDTLQDICNDSEFIVLWGVDPLFHNLYGGIDQARVWRYWKELGKKVVVIEPLLNEAGLWAADKWLPIYPGTDGSLACAIAYQWIIDGTYDRSYLDTHAIGFDEEHLPEGAPAGSSFKTYILGESDGIPKTPEWAEKITGIDAATITVLAREWGTKPTSLWVMTGGSCRREFAHEFSRLAATLQAMQGIGKAGVNIMGPFLSMSGPYDSINQIGPSGYADGGINNALKHYPLNENKQIVTYQRFLECLQCDEGDKVTWMNGHFFSSPEEFFTEHEYPAEGASRLRLFWQRGSSMINAPDRSRQIKAYRSAQLETIIISNPWFDRDCRYADIVLPVTTLYERQDFTEPAKVGQYVPPAYSGLRCAIFSKKCIEPEGESKTDLDILAGLAERLGYADVYLEGNTEDTLIETLYAKTNIPLEFDEFKEKGYYVWPAPKNYTPNKQFAAFYHDPEGNPVDTPSGKIEIFSQLIFQHYGADNPEIPPVPHYIPEKEGRQSETLRQRHPLQLLMAHPKFRFHGKFNNVTWYRNVYKVKGPDGYEYEPVYLTPADAKARGLVEGDIVSCFNDRGQTLAGVRITQRIPEGVAWLTYGSWNDPLDASENPIDRGGDGSMLTNPGVMSCHHIGGAYNSTLFDVRKVDIDELAATYPEGMAGTYSSWNREG